MTTVPEFPFPYPAYDVQLDFMQALFDTCEKGGGSVAILESPTGTGKSLSIAVSGLTWLLRHYDDAAEQRKQRDALFREAEKAKKKQENVKTDDKSGFEFDSDEDELDDLLENKVEDFASRVFRQTELRRQRELQQEKAELLQRMRARFSEFSQRRRRELKRSRNARVQANELEKDAIFDGISEQKRKSAQRKPAKTEVEDEDLILSDNDDAVQEKPDNGEESVTDFLQSLMGAQAQFVLEYDDQDSSKRKDLLRQTPQIIFASRTHSQLSNFAAEVRKTTFAHFSTKPDENSEKSLLSERVRLIPLGSRQQLCVNERVRQHACGSSRRLNELCLDLQKSQGRPVDVPITSASTLSDEERKIGGCPYLGSSKRSEMFRDAALSGKVRDIEDMAQLGRFVNACPYYGVRAAAPSAHIVTLPYASLLSRSARDSLGVNIENNIIVIDEAHNINEELLRLQSVELSKFHACRALMSLQRYLRKYKNRLGAKNRKDCILLLKALGALVAVFSGAASTDGSIMSVSDFAFRFKLSEHNFLALRNFLDRSQLSRKLRGFVDRHILSDENTKDKQLHLRNRHVCSVSVCIEFGMALCRPSHVGRVVLENTSNSDDGVKSKRINNLRFILLHASEDFLAIAAKARAVILCGGTMSPMSSFATQLLATSKSESEMSKALLSIRTLSCSHVVPSSSLNLLTVPCFDFAFKTRRNEAQLHNVAMLLKHVSASTRILIFVTMLFLNVEEKTVPAGGTVVFFQSFRFLSHCVDTWRRNQVDLGTTYIEPRQSEELKSLWERYRAETAESSALLFCVVGGKLSEGVDFRDRLARSVVVLGVPFADASDPVLQERRKYLDRVQLAVPKMTSFDFDSTGDTAKGEHNERLSGQAYYEALAMRAVNQCIGRGIRHKEDFASVLLCDRRYAGHLQHKLPAWTRPSLRQVRSLKYAVEQVRAFFASGRSRDATD
ncbi:MAG: hypothetical protein MHM6MM_000198 [Cercozoa sp. M6MM]